LTVQYEEIYLKSIHEHATKENLLDLHTYLYWKDFESCPICNEWLTVRGKPQATA